VRSTVRKAMRKLLLPLALLLTVLLASAFGQTGGRDLYIAKCSACHAPDGSGNGTVGRSLRLDGIGLAIKNLTDDQLRQLILEGKGKMPPNKKLDDEKIRNLIVFLRDLVAGNPETGRAVAEAQEQPLARVDEVFRDKCSACHGLDGTGRTTIGRSLNIPDLTSGAVQSKNVEELAEIIGQGKGRMPGYAKKFNPVQARQLAAHLQTFARTEDQKGPVKSAESRATAPRSPSPSTRLRCSPPQLLRLQARLEAALR
jgi:mono/diheme cytochrome c family protein